jgi:hypothetical protein
VPDLIAFIRCIAPVLEKRLAEKVRPGYSGELRIGFYRSGLELQFEQGTLTCAKKLAPEVLESANAAFPGLTFLQVLFGYRSLDDLRRAFPDCWVDNDKARPLLEALFPRQASAVWPIA